jgi:hypothetical protein
LQALPLLVSVVGMLIFFLFLFAVAGVSIYKNVYHYGCHHPTEGWETNTQSPDGFGCGRRQCPANYTCLVSDPLHVSMRQCVSMPCCKLHQHAACIV